MGTWAAPQSDNQMRILEKAMQNPVTPALYYETLAGVIGDDGLCDLVDRLARVDKESDVRSAIAHTLEMWMLWSPLSSWKTPWPSDLLERARFLAKSFLDVSGAEGRFCAISNDPIAAVAEVLRVTDRKPGEEFETAMMVKAVSPWLTVVHDMTSDRIYRVDRVFGTVYCAPADKMAAITASYFEDPAPKPLN